MRSIKIDELLTLENPANPLRIRRINKESIRSQGLNRNGLKTDLLPFPLSVTDLPKSANKTAKTNQFWQFSMAPASKVVVGKISDFPEPNIFPGRGCLFTLKI